MVNEVDTLDVVHANVPFSRLGDVEPVARLVEGDAVRVFETGVGDLPVRFAEIGSDPVYHVRLPSRPVAAAALCVAHLMRSRTRYRDVARSTLQGFRKTHHQKRRASWRVRQDPPAALDVRVLLAGLCPPGPETPPR